MDNLLDSVIETEFVSISVLDPMRHRVDFWHTYVDYEISLNTNSMCFAKKTSCVRRRYNEFVWLRHSLQQNLAYSVDLPKLLPWNPFFRMNDTEQVNQRMEGLQTFLENVIYTPLLLSDSRLHLFLQSDLSMAKIERCVQGLTRYTVAQAIQMQGRSDIDPLEDGCRASYDSDCEISAVSPYLGKTDVNLSHIYREAVIRPVFLSAFGRDHQVWDPVWTLPFEPSLVTIEPLVTNELFTSKSMFSLKTDIGH